MAIRINVTEYFDHICSTLNFKRTLLAYQITVTTTCSSLQYCSKQQKLKKFRKVSTIGCSICAVQNWRLVWVHILRNTKKNTLTSSKWVGSVIGMGYGWRTIFLQFLVFFLTPRPIIITFSFPFKSNITLRLRRLDLPIFLLVEHRSFCNCSFPSYTMDLLSEDYCKVFQSLIQLLQAFFLLLSSTSCDSTRSIFCCFSFSTVNFCSSVSTKYLTPAFFMELISSIVHGNFRTPPALINSKSRSKTMDFSFITYPWLCKSCLLIENPCSVYAFP